jgi:hypothetical protein
MKKTLAILVTLLGLAAGILAEEKAPANKQAQYNPKELGVEKQRKGVKWEGPDLDAAKGQRKTKQKAKGKK